MQRRSKQRRTHKIVCRGDQRSPFYRIVRKEGCAVIDYTPLWQTMERKGVSQYQLIKSGIDNKTLDSLKKGNNITLLTLEKLCMILDCTPNDVVRFEA